MTQASEMITDAKDYARDMVDKADTALDGAVRAAEGITFGSVTVGKITLPTAPTFGLGLAAPQLPPVAFNPPAAIGSGPTFQDVSSIDPSQGLPAAFTKPAPITAAPTAPSQLPEFRETVDQLDLNIVIGAAPTMNFGVQPTIGGFTPAVRPNTSIDKFDGIVPVFDAVAPGDLGQQMASWYHAAAPEFITMVNGHVDAELTKLNPQYHAQMARIETQLTKYLDGGTGLKPEVEDAIYARGQKKNDVEAKRVQDAAFADVAARGFTLPSGALASSLARARQDAANLNAAKVNEIIVLQAEMEQKNLQFAVTTSAGLRTAMVGASMSYMQSLGMLNGQALDYAKGILGAVVETFNATVRAYTAKVETLRAQVAGYDAYLKGVFADVERFKAEIAGEQAKAQVDLAKVQAYTAVVNSEQAKIMAYKAHVDALVSKASLEKLKVEVFQAKVQAYSAQVQAKNSEWQGYSAAWSGEVSKLAGYRSEVDAYTAQMQGYSAGISGKSAAAQAQAMTNDARAKQYAAELQGYSAGVEAAGKVATTELENNRQEIVAFQAEAAAKTAELNSYIAYYDATAKVSVEQAKLDIHALLTSSELSMKQQATLAQLYTGNATIHANLAGAALAGINALAVESFTG